MLNSDHLRALLLQFSDIPAFSLTKQLSRVTRDVSSAGLLDTWQFANTAITKHPVTLLTFIDIISYM